MNLLNSFLKWRVERYENYILQMKNKNNCPDCSGRGFLMFPTYELAFYNESLNCPSCSGSGLYSEWLKQF